MASEALDKVYKNLDDEQLDKFIAISERIMRKPAGLLLEQAGFNASTEAPFTLLDHACGTGPIAAHLLATLDKSVLSQSEMLCADVNNTMVDTLKKRIERYGWSNVKTTILDAQDSGLPAQSFSHVTLNFAMHIIPEPEAVLRDAMRLLKPGGTLAFSVWHKDNEGWAPDMRSCFETLPFEAPTPDHLMPALNGKFEFVDPDRLPAVLEKAGFEDVKVQTVNMVVPIEGAEDFMTCFGMMKDWVIRTLWSEESKTKASGMLDEHMVKHLTEKYGGHGWDMPWTMVLVTGRKPDAGKE